jgi:hypothetical protein
MNLTLESLGLTKEELQSRVIAKLCDDLTTLVFADEDSDPVAQPSSFKRKLDEALQKRTEESIRGLAAKLAHEYVLPNVTKYLEKPVLAKTDEWRQPRESPITFIEYLVQRCDAYMREEVNYEGQTKGESCSSCWTKSTTRVGYLVEKHLQFNIERAMKEAMARATGRIKAGLENAVEIALDKVLVGLKATVEIKEVR